MALAGFEPENLGTKGQHATPRPRPNQNPVFFADFQFKLPQMTAAE